MKKIICTLCTGVLLLCLSTAQAESPTSTLADLRAETADGWHQTYEAHGRTIQIDADVTLPDTDTFPILTVRLAAAPLSQEQAEALMDGVATHDQRDDTWTEWLPGGGGVLRLINHDGYFTYSLSDSYDVLCNESGWGGLHYEENTLPLATLDWDTPLIENSTLTLRDADSFLGQQIERFFGAQVQAQLTQVVTRSPWITRKGAFLTPCGTYVLSYRQAFGSIPVLRRILEVYNQCSAKLPAPEEHLEFGGEAKMDLSTPEEYALWLDLYQKQETKYEDVPLCSFATVKAAVEKRIDEGLLRGISSIRLGYIVYPDSQDNTLFWLLPGWVVEGDVYPDAKTELTKRQIKEGSDDWYKGTVVVDGQRGTLFDAKDNSKTRCVRPELIGW